MNTVLELMILLNSRVFRYDVKMRKTFIIQIELSFVKLQSLIIWNNSNIIYHKTIKSLNPINSIRPTIHHIFCYIPFEFIFSNSSSDEWLSSSSLKLKWKKADMGEDGRDDWCCILQGMQQALEVVEVSM